MVRIRDENPNTVEYWDKKHAKCHNRNLSLQIQRFLDFGFLPKDESVTVLDVGSGEIVYAKILTHITWSSIDLSPVVIERNRHLSPQGFHYALDICKDDIPGVFDYVISHHTFEHLDDPLIALEKCKQAAKRKVIIAVPYEDAWGNDGSHIHKFTLQDPFTDYIEHKITQNNEEIFYVFEGKAK